MPGGRFRSPAATGFRAATIPTAIILVSLLAVSSSAWAVQKTEGVSVALEQETTNPSPANEQSQSEPVATASDTTAPTSVDLVAIEERAIKRAVERAALSVAQLETIGASTTAGNLGTAICVSEDGLFLTATYNLRGEPSSIFLRANAIDAGSDTNPTADNGSNSKGLSIGRFIARQVAIDHSRHLTLLKVIADEGVRFRPIAYADMDRVRPGQTMIAVGRVYEVDRPNLSVGIVSATRRIWGRAMQTDAKISRANYGGPLVNLFGDAVGILLPMNSEEPGIEAGDDWYDSGIGFSVPLSNYRDSIERLATGEDLHQGLLGVAFQGGDVYADAAKVSYCYPKSPASEAGLRPDDVIVGVNGMPVQRQSELRNAMGPLYAGESVSLKVRRGDESVTLRATLVKEIEPYTEVAMGVVLDENADSELRVRHVDSNAGDGASSNEEEASLQPGDRIVGSNGAPTESIASLRATLNELAAGDTIELAVAVDSKDDSQDHLRNVSKEAVTVSLSPLSAEPLDDLPPHIEIEHADQASANLIEISVAESSNRCIAIVPGNDFAVVGRPGVFVWVAQPGTVDEKQLLEDVKLASQQRNVIVMMPFSLNPQTWTPGESSFIAKALQKLEKTVPFNPQLVAIGGEKTAGSMACLTAFTHRERFRGLVMVEAGFPGRLPEVVTAPGKRLMIFLSTGPESKLGNHVKKVQQVLLKKRFAVHVDSRQSATMIDIFPRVAAWTDSLHRQ